MSNDLSVLFKNIANEIREKLGTQQTYRPSTFPELIKSIPTGEVVEGGIKGVFLNTLFFSNHQIYFNSNIEEAKAFIQPKIKFITTFKEKTNDINIT